MNNIFEDYREIDNVRDKLDLIVELVNSAPRRVFLTKEGVVQAVVIGRVDYQQLWQLELDHDMKVGDEEEARGEVVSHEEVLRRTQEILNRKRGKAS